MPGHGKWPASSTVMHSSSITIDKAHAASWDDELPSSSSSSSATALDAAVLHRRRLTPRVTSPRRRNKALAAVIPILLAAILVAITAIPVAAISDPGIFEPDDSSQPKNDAGKSSSTNRGSAPLAALLAPPSSHELLSAVYQGHPVSLPPGCYRTSDLIGQSSVNPWSADVMSSLLGSAKARGSRLRSELVLCPVPKAGSNAGYKLFSVAGFIEVAQSRAEGEDGRSGYDRVGVRPALTIGQKDLSQQMQLADDEASWPAVGQEAEGYWRQRDGRLQWEAPPPEPMPLVAPDDSSTMPLRSSPADHASTSGDGQADHAQAYDAWTASIGGESADDWLSFEEWRQRHQAEKAKVEAERRAENKQKKKAKQAAAAAANDTAPPAPVEGGEGPPVGATSEQSSAVSDAGSLSSIAAAPVTPSSAVDSAAGEKAQATSPSSPQQSSSPAPAAEATPAAASSMSDTPPSAPSQQAARTSPSHNDSRPENAAPPVAVGADPAVAESAPAAKDPATSLKSLRHRWNFASMDCAAVIHRTNPAAKFASAILNEKKDRYMLSPCPDVSRNKDGSGGVFVVVELCDEISIDTVVLANHEFFSRMFKRFKVSVAPSLKGGGNKQDEEWRELGIFRARNARGPQVFNITSPSTGFFRYVRIDFLEYYGNEYYCPLSLLRVYGLTQLDHFRREEEKDRRALEASERLTIGDGEEEDEDDDLSIADDDLKEPSFELPDYMRAPADGGAWDAVWPHEAPFGSTMGKDSSSVFESASSPYVPDRSHQASSTSSAPSDRPDSAPSSWQASGSSPTSQAQVPLSEAARTSSAAAATTQVPTPSVVGNGGSTPTTPAAAAASAAPSPPAKPGVCPVGLSRLSDLERAAMLPAICPKPADGAHSASQRTLSASQQSAAASSSAKSAPSSTGATGSQQQGAGRAGGGGQQQQQQQGGTGNGGNAGGPGSESIYRTITKRLNALEANATLSLQYIEHSGQMLREVFRTMEKRQEHRLGDMLRALNSSNWRQIEALKRRQQVDLQRAIFEFDVHKQQIEAERRELLSQVSSLASEIRFERRLGVVQFVLVLGLFAFMATTRGPAPGLLHAQMGRLATSASQPRSFRSLMRGHTPTPLIKGDDSERSGAVTPQPPIRSTSDSLLSPKSMRVSASNDGLDNGQEAVAEERAMPRRGSREATVTRDTPELMDGSKPPASAPPAIPTGDFAEMSPSELRSYLGFNSPRGARSQTPAGGIEEGEDVDASLHDETGDEGLETAFEDHDSDEDEDDFEVEEDGEGEATSALPRSLTLDATTPGELTAASSAQTIDGLAAQAKLRSAAHRVNIPTSPSRDDDEHALPPRAWREPITPGKVSSRILAGHGSAPRSGDVTPSPPHVKPSGIIRPRSATMEVRFPRRGVFGQSPDSDASDDDEGSGSGAEADRSNDGTNGGWQRVVSRRQLSLSTSSGPAAAMTTPATSSNPATPQRPRSSFLSGRFGGSSSSTSTASSSPGRRSPASTRTNSISSSHSSGGIVSNSGGAGGKDDYASRRWSLAPRSPTHDTASRSLSSSSSVTTTNANRMRTASLSTAALSRSGSSNGGTTTPQSSARNRTTSAMAAGSAGRGA